MNFEDKQQAAIFLEDIKHKLKSHLPINIDSWHINVTPVMPPSDGVSLGKYDSQVLQPSFFYKSISRTINPKFIE